MKKKIKVYMNAGRWLVKCPKCSTPLRAHESGVVCPRCHPGILAKALQPISGGLFRPVADIELVDAAKREAENAGEFYIPEFPLERSQIERILRMRRSSRNMNWVPGESLDDLRRQNLEHGDPVPDKE